LARPLDGLDVEIDVAEVNPDKGYSELRGLLAGILPCI